MVKHRDTGAISSCNALAKMQNRMELIDRAASENRSLTSAPLGSSSTQKKKPFKPKIIAKSRNNIQSRTHNSQPARTQDTTPPTQTRPLNYDQSFTRINVQSRTKNTQPARTQDTMPPTQTRSLNNEQSFTHNNVQSRTNNAQPARTQDTTSPTQIRSLNNEQSFTHNNVQSRTKNPQPACTQNTTPPTQTRSLNKEQSFKGNNIQSRTLNTQLQRTHTAPPTQTLIPDQTRGLDLVSLVKEVLQEQRSIRERMDALETTANACLNILKQLSNKKNRANKKMPQFFPFETVENLLNFDKVSDEEYNNAVTYLAYIGGVNASDAAALYLKKCFKTTESLVTGVTWLGSKKANIVALNETRFAAACEDAMSENKNINDPDKSTFATAMTKALKSIKEEEEYRRKKMKRAATNNADVNDGQPLLQRRRLDAVHNGANIDFEEGYGNQERDGIGDDGGIEDDGDGNNEIDSEEEERLMRVGAIQGYRDTLQLEYLEEDTQTLQQHFTFSPNYAPQFS
ncbi:uncharacterized protein LOC107980631 isoform X2 [Nasonia vitripennis]|uniref:DUF4806 domain-containing protein n=3 Tax=Nasonia vitripennis TaxID=7425 RepID=A0A7M7Q214_NASVI|nr:uncharacterized protein LOC107980631 isoform X2 [Nasonia vitripennis]